MSQTLFERIIAREIPVKFVYEDDLIVAFHDIQPAAPVHLLVVPKRPLSGIAAAAPGDEALLGHLFVKIPAIARQAGVAEGGYRLVVNSGRAAGEAVPHLHVHLLGGRSLNWPPG